MDRERSGGLFVGLTLIALGLIFMGERLQLGPMWSLHRLWPVLLILFGLVKLAAPRPGRPRWGGVWVLLTGVLFLLDANHVVSFHQTWPLFIVAGGLAIMFSRQRRDGSPHDGSGTP